MHQGMVRAQENHSTTIRSQLGLVALDHAEKHADSGHYTSFK